MMQRIATDPTGSDSAPILPRPTTLYRVRTVDDRGWVLRTTYCTMPDKVRRMYAYLQARGFVVFVDVVTVQPLPRTAPQYGWMHRAGIATRRDEA